MENQQNILRTLWPLIQVLKPAFALDVRFGLFQSWILTVLYFYGLRLILFVWFVQGPLEKLFIVAISFTALFMITGQTAVLVLLVITRGTMRGRYTCLLKRWFWTVVKVLPSTFLLTYCFFTGFVILTILLIFALWTFPTWLPLGVGIYALCLLVILCTYSLSFTALCDGSDFVEAVFFSIEAILRNPFAILFQFFVVGLIGCILFSSIALYAVLHISIYFAWTFCDYRDSFAHIERPSVLRWASTRWLRNPYDNLKATMEMNSFERLDCQMLMFVKLLSTTLLNWTGFLLQKAVYIVYSRELLVAMKSYHQ